MKEILRKLQVIKWRIQLKKFRIESKFKKWMIERLNLTEELDLMVIIRNGERA